MVAAASSIFMAAVLVLPGVNDQPQDAGIRHITDVMTFVALDEPPASRPQSDVARPQPPRRVVAPMHRPPGRPALEPRPAPGRVPPAARGRGRDAENRPSRAIKMVRRQTEVVSLQHGSARKLVETLSKWIALNRTESDQAPATVAASEATNHLLIRGTPSQVDAMKQLVQQLDVKVPQIRVQAMLLDLRSAGDNGDRHTSFVKQGTSEKTWNIPHIGNTLWSPEEISVRGCSILRRITKPW